ncbi:MAG: glycosyltransferase family 2 protein [Planctomycetota bacterium]|nr:MAG: glycosyltransferase family 2 protein [Planctomycetota bacterium]
MPVDPAVSVLIAARDAAATLPSTLRSVARQTRGDWECVVADDGSTDDTAAVVERAGAVDPRFRLLRLPRRGVVAARNAALEVCRGRFVALLDADDLMHRRRLERQLALLAAEPDLAGVGCHVRYFPRRAVGPGRAAYERWLNGFLTPTRLRAERFVEMPLGHPTLILRAEVLRAFGWRDRGWPEDWDLLLRLFGAGHDLGVVAERLHAWRLRPDSLSAGSPAYSLAAFTRCRAAFLAEQFLIGRDDYVLWGYGGTGKALRAALLEHGKEPSHIVEIHPGRLGNRIHGAPVVAPAALGRPPLTEVPVVVSVAGEQARRIIREALADLGRREGRDAVLAA